MTDQTQCPNCSTYKITSSFKFLHPRNGKPWMGRGAYSFFKIFFGLSLLLTVLVGCIAFSGQFNGAGVMFFLAALTAVGTFIIKRTVEHTRVRIDHECRNCGYRWTEESENLSSATS
jgi:hypothetical protein